MKPADPQHAESPAITCTICGQAFGKGTIAVIDSGPRRGAYHRRCVNAAAAREGWQETYRIMSPADARRLASEPSARESMRSLRDEDFDRLEARARACLPSRGPEGAWASDVLALVQAVREARAVAKRVSTYHPYKSDLPDWAR